MTWWNRILLRLEGNKDGGANWQDPNIVRWAARLDGDDTTVGRERAWTGEGLGEQRREEQSEVTVGLGHKHT